MDGNSIVIRLQMVPMHGDEDRGQRATGRLYRNFRANKLDIHLGDGGCGKIHCRVGLSDEYCVVGHKMVRIDHCRCCIGEASEYCSPGGYRNRNEFEAIDRVDGDVDELSVQLFVSMGSL